MHVPRVVYVVCHVVEAGKCIAIKTRLQLVSEVRVVLFTVGLQILPYLCL